MTSEIPGATTLEEHRDPITGVVVSKAPVPPGSHYNPISGTTIFGTPVPPGSVYNPSNGTIVSK